MKGGPKLDRVIHERARLMILASLMSSQEPETGFTELKQRLGLSAGNLSIQLKNLSEAGYVKIAKSFVGRKPNTSVRITARGSAALSRYLAEMEGLIKSLKPAAGRGRAGKGDGDGGDSKA